MHESPIRVLLIEDNKADVRLIQEMLRGNRGKFQITVASKLATAFESLTRGGIDVVLLDLGLPDSTGFETFTRLHENASNLPIIVLTGLDDETVAVRAVREGAQDFIPKAILTQTILDRTIRYAIERKHAQKAIAESEERYRLAIESSIDGVAILKGTTLTYASHELARMFGYEVPVDLIGKPLATIVHPEHQEMAADYCLSKQMGRSAPSKYEFKGLRKDGRVIFVEVSETTVTYHGETNCLAYVRDVTERKRIERELLRIQKQEAISELSAGIAHDFNNLLSVILGYINMARLESTVHAQAHEHLDEAEKGVMQARDLVQKFMAFARGGTAEGPLVPVKELIATAVERISGAPGVACEVLLPDDLWPVKSDRSLIIQVLHNILENAGEAMPDGGAIRIRAENVELTSESSGLELPADSGRYIKISISDEGVGIPENCLHRVFDPYYSTKSRGTRKGMGLGLTLAFSAVRKLGGDIHLESRCGSGTTVHLYLPAAQKPLAAQTESEPVHVRGGKKVLILDEHETMRRLIQSMLESMGHQAQASLDGNEALQMYAEALAAGAPFDVVIVEQTIEGGSGGERNLARLLEIDPGAQAVVTTKSPDDPIMRSFGQRGFKAALAKPFSMKELEQILTGIPARKT
jgi:two-component system, cell cycle sensor histidine kinase and response regulator CckA